MATTVADYLLARLGEWGVDKVFGFPGDGINGILAALDQRIDLFAVHVFDLVEIDLPEGRVIDVR